MCVEDGESWGLHILQCRTIPRRPCVNQGECNIVQKREEVGLYLTGCQR